VAAPAINVMAVRSIEATQQPRFYSILNVLNNSAKVLAPAIGTISSSLASEAAALTLSIAFSAASFVAFAFIAIRAPEAPVRGPAGKMRGRIGEVISPAMLQALGFGAIGLVLWLATRHADAILPLLFFAIGTASARYAIALNVYMATHYAAAIGRASATLQAWQQAMIFVAPLIGAFVLDALGTPALFAFATGSAALSFALFFAATAGAGAGWRGTLRSECPPARAARPLTPP
jgi:MFS family permease